MRLDEQAAPIARRLRLLDPGDLGVSVPRPAVEAAPRKPSKHRPPSGRSGRRVAWRKRLDLPAAHPDRLHTVRRASDLTGVPGWLIYRLADKGRIEIVRVGPNGGTLLIPEPELARIKAEDDGRRRFPRRVDLRAV